MEAKRRIKLVFALFCNDWHEFEYAWFFASHPYMEVIGQTHSCPSMTSLFACDVCFLILGGQCLILLNWMCVYEGEF